MAAKETSGSASSLAKDRRATKVATPWGKAAVVDEVAIRQQAGERRFSSVVQLLEGPKGECLVRFAYSSDGRARRGPVTLRARDVERLRTELGKHVELAQAIGLGGDA